MLGLSWKGIDCTELVNNSSSNRHFLVALGIWFLPCFYTRNGDISNLTVDGDRNANQKNLQPPKSGTANFIRELFLFWCITCCPHQIFWGLFAEHNLIKAMRNHTYKYNTWTESTPLLNKLNTFHTHTWVNTHPRTFNTSLKINIVCTTAYNLFMVSCHHHWLVEILPFLLQIWNPVHHSVFKNLQQCSNQSTFLQLWFGLYLWPSASWSLPRASLILGTWRTPLFLPSTQCLESTCPQ